MFFLLESLIILFATLYVKITGKRPKLTKCLVGKTALVTGGNKGIGYEISLNLASRGCRVIIANRSDAEEARQRIIRETGNNEVICKKLDLASFKSVRAFAKDINATVKRLDILVNNAGIAGSDVTVTEDGIHPVMQINFFGHFLLTYLLLDLLKRSAPSRILHSNSGASYMNTLNLDTLTKCKSTANAYGNSKLASMMASDYFATKLKPHRVVSNTIQPGMMRTEIFDTITLKQHGLYDKFAMSFTKLCTYFIGKECWKAAEFMVHILSSDEYENVTGKFFLEDRPFRKPPKAYDAVFTESILEASKKILHIKDE